MSKVIYLNDVGGGNDGEQGARASGAASPRGAGADRRGRPLRDLRISVTDRCNFRCTYCMPREVFGGNYKFMPHASLLTFEEIARVARVEVEQIGRASCRERVCQYV